MPTNERMAATDLDLDLDLDLLGLWPLAALF